MSSKKWCNTCMRSVVVATTDIGFICCTNCGKVVAQDVFREDVTFSKNAAGQSQVQGTTVRSVASDHSASRERTLDRAYETISDMIVGMGVGGGDRLAKPSVRFYEIALENRFLFGRRAEHVAAACLYITCREYNIPFLLIEFSEHLRVNVYVLGAVFLQLCKVLHLTEHDIVRKLVDPSLFIHRFAHNLLGENNPEIEKTALRIMTSMKRDWMQTGRKPSGLCGAALYVSALSHGFKFSKSDVVKVVHICEATLTKRLIEFEATESGSLTIEEFNQRAEEIENNDHNNKVSHSQSGFVSKEGELICQHKGNEEIHHFAHGMCRVCYIEFERISGGLDGGSEPPAFQRAEKARLALQRAQANNNAKHSLLDNAEQADTGETSVDKDQNAKNSLLDNAETVETSGSDKDQNAKHSLLNNAETVETSGSDKDQNAKHSLLDNAETVETSGSDKDQNAKHSEIRVEQVENSGETEKQENDEDCESDHFSDIDDAEVDAYLHNEEETEYKKTIWEKVNWEYIEEQAQKAAAGYVPKPKKERQKKKDGEGINAKSAAEAAQQMLSKKRVISSKVNHDRLKELFDDEPVGSDTPNKKSRTDDDNNEETFEDYGGTKAYVDDYQDDDHVNNYNYNEDGYEEFDDGLF